MSDSMSIYPEVDKVFDRLFQEVHNVDDPNKVWSKRGELPDKHYLLRDPELIHLMKKIPDLPADQRSAYGQYINERKKMLIQRIEFRTSQRDGFDEVLPVSNIDVTNSIR